MPQSYLCLLTPIHLHPYIPTSVHLRNTHCQGTVLNSLSENLFKENGLNYY